MTTNDPYSGDNNQPGNQRILFAIQAYGYAIYELIAREGIFDWQARHALITGNSRLRSETGQELSDSLRTKDGQVVFGFMRDVLASLGLPAFSVVSSGSENTLILDCKEEADVVPWVQAYCDSVLSGEVNSKYFRTSGVSCDCDACQAVDLLAERHPEMLASPLTPAVIQAMLMLVETSDETGKIELSDWVDDEVDDDGIPFAGITNMAQYLAEHLEEIPDDFVPIPKLDRASIESLCDQLFHYGDEDNEAGGPRES